MEIYYAGIGARKTPEDVCRKMFAAGRAMAKLGFILRSGGAPGADDAFEQGCDAGEGKKQIFLPYRNFNRNASELYTISKEARAIAREFHPNWTILGDRGRDFMGRNSYQVLGPDLESPSSFILCWTEEGAITGGTGQALRIAQDRGIPILNFATDEDERISDFILEQSERIRG